MTSTPYLEETSANAMFGSINYMLDPNLEENSQQLQNLNSTDTDIFKYFLNDEMDNGIDTTVLLASSELSDASEQMTPPQLTPESSDDFLRQVLNLDLPF